MAVTLVKFESTVGIGIKVFQGLSTDEKPQTNLGYGSTFYEVNTGNTYIYDINTNPITGDNWWEV